MPDRIDRLLVLAAALLVGAIAWTGLRSATHGDGAPPRPARTTAASEPAPVPEDVRLVPSSTAFLPHCPGRDLTLAVGPRGTLTLRFAGSRCHVPPLGLRAVERDAAGTVVYDGPALAHESLSGNYAVRGAATARLLGPCTRSPLTVTVSGSGLRASGTVRCRHVR
jgi:hypothetical protein